MKETLTQSCKVVENVQDAGECQNKELEGTKQQLDTLKKKVKILEGELDTALTSREDHSDALQIETAKLERLTDLIRDIWLELQPRENNA